MLNVAIITGSTRPGRKSEAVARWVHGIAARRDGASFELVDIADFDLPLLDEPVPPMMHQYSKPHTVSWAAKIAAFDAFVFVTPEYNHGTSGALKNAIDFLFQEWNDKAAGFVGYGSAGGVRAVESLRLVMGRAQGCRRSRPGRPFALHRLRERHDIQARRPPGGGRQHHARRPHPVGRGVQDHAHAEA